LFCFEIRGHRAILSKRGRSPISRRTEGNRGASPFCRIVTWTRL
jgi:hypothetical protein